MPQTLLFGTLIQSASIPTTALGGGVVSGSAQIIGALPVGIVSSSAQIPSNPSANIFLAQTLGGL